MSHSPNNEEKSAVESQAPPDTSSYFERISDSELIGLTRSILPRNYDSMHFDEMTEYLEESLSEAKLIFIQRLNNKKFTDLGEYAFKGFMMKTMKNIIIKNVRMQIRYEELKQLEKIYENISFQDNAPFRRTDFEIYRRVLRKFYRRAEKIESRVLWSLAKVFQVKFASKRFKGRLPMEEVQINANTSCDETIQKKDESFDTKGCLTLEQVKYALKKSWVKLSMILKEEREAK